MDYRVEFSKWWINEFKAIKFPPQGTVFDYYIDQETKQWTLWTERVPKFELDPDMPLQVIHAITNKSTLRWRDCRLGVLKVRGKQESAHCEGSSWMIPNYSTGCLGSHGGVDSNTLFPGLAYGPSGTCDAGWRCRKRQNCTRLRKASCFERKPRSG